MQRNEVIENRSAVRLRAWQALLFTVLITKKIFLFPDLNKIHVTATPASEDYFCHHVNEKNSFVGVKMKVFLLPAAYVSLLHIYTLTQFAILSEQLKGQSKARAWFNLKLWLRIFLTLLIDCQKISLVTDALWSVRKALFAHGCG